MSSEPADWTVSDLSTEYVKVLVRATVGGVNPYNPTSDQVQFAFVEREGEPVSGDWVDGAWEDEAVVTPNGTVHQYRALGLVGPGAKVLAQGYYDVYVKIFDSPETPVKYVGILEVGR